MTKTGEKDRKDQICHIQEKVRITESSRMWKREASQIDTSTTQVVEVVHHQRELQNFSLASSFYLQAEKVPGVGGDFMFQ